MRITQAFKCADGAVFLTAEDAAKHDFTLSLRKLFKKKAITPELLADNMTQLESMIADAKKRDTTVERTPESVRPTPRLVAAG